MDDKEYMSQHKYNELKEELLKLKTGTRREVAEKLEFAKSLGDLSENAEFQEARDAQAQLEGRIIELESILKDAQIVRARRSSGEVEIGSKVTVRRAGERTDKKYTLVGSEEVDMAEGKISHKSPLGESLLGHKKGDAVEFEAPAGVIKMKIVDVK